MFNDNFDNVFNQLKVIEEKLAKGASKEEKERYVEEIIGLRKVMDKCIQTWLRFEERVNRLQEMYGLNLPDDVPEGFLMEMFNIKQDEEKQGEVETGAKEDSPNKGVATDEAFPGNQFFESMREEASLVSLKRGLGFYDLSMTNEAVEEFEKLVELEPNFIMGHFFLGHVYLHKQEYDKGEKELRLVLALTEDQQIKGMAYNTLGNIYAARGKHELALEEFLLALEASDEIREVHFNLGATYYNLKDFHRSISYFQKARELFPNDWEIYFYLGKAYEHAGDYDNALRCLETACNINPNSILANFELGILYHLLNQREKARLQYEKILEIKAGQAKREETYSKSN